MKERVQNSFPLTFKNRASYKEKGRTASLQMFNPYPANVENRVSS
jgi:hypothetical protein